ncbi:MAG: lactate racemase domain-containing protein [Spirochaetia bacterium]|nr:lactate racemase domain-containing protein [Spirochaetia bacterium]
MARILRDSVWDRNGMVAAILQNVQIPQMATITQKLKSQKIRDIETHIHSELSKSHIGETIKPGMKVAITVGSRGIGSITLITRALVREVRARGGEPFIVPAMGSHGGATAAGQRQLLEGLGITESSVDAPIRATMDTTAVGKTSEGRTVHVDAHAAAADGIIVAGRIKLHPSFRGEYESGLMKMMAIGLGKQRGAQICHAEGFGKMAEYVPAFGRVVLESSPILFGVAVVENGLDEPHTIEAIPPVSIPSREPELLKLSQHLMARIPFDHIDILVVDRIGKDISGDGMDPNVTGSFATPFSGGGPEVSRYVVLDITPESRGNGLGIGMTDFSTKRVFDQLDFDAMYPNSLTSTVPEPSRLPLIMGDDCTAIKAAVHTTNISEAQKIRMVRIVDSSHLSRFMVSEALLPEVRQNRDLQVKEEPHPLEFDENGVLIDLGHL